MDYVHLPEWGLEALAPAHSSPEELLTFLEEMLCTGELTIDDAINYLNDLKGNSK